MGNVLRRRTSYAQLSPRPHRQVRVQLHERLRRRHLHQGPPDHQPGPALRPSDLEATCPAAAAANPPIPNLLPALDFAGSGVGASWDNISPRVGFTYALNESRKTVLRASYARYASQISTGDGTYDNPIGSVSYLAYYWDDANSDQVGPDERDPARPGGPVLRQHRPGEPGGRDRRPTRSTPTTRPRPTTSSWWASTTSCSRTSRSARPTPGASRNDITWRPRNEHGRPPTTTFGHGDRDTDAPTPRAVHARRRSGAPTLGTGPLLLRTGPITDLRLQRRRALDDQAPGQQVDGPRGLLLERLDRELRRRRASATPASRTRRAPRPPPSVAACTRARSWTAARSHSSPADSGKGNVIYSSVMWQVTANALCAAAVGHGVRRLRCSPARATRGRRTSRISVPARLNTAIARRQRRRPPLPGHLERRLPPGQEHQDRRRLGRAERGAVQRVQRWHRDQRTRDAASAAFNRLDEILSPRVARFGLRFLF